MKSGAKSEFICANIQQSIDAVVAYKYILGWGTLREDKNLIKKAT